MKRTMEDTIKSITPLYSSQADINKRVENISDEDKMRYEELLKRYNTAIAETVPDHEYISNLIQQANEILQK